MGNNNKKSILNSEAFPGILLLATTVLALILANTELSNYVILPLFAFANTGIALGGSLNLTRDYPLMIGIILGLVIGKPLGIMLFGYLGSLIGITKRPKDTSWYDVLEVSILAGIGFTMSLFVSELAFAGEKIELSVSKISILIAAVISIILASILTSIGERLQHKHK